MGMTSQILLLILFPSLSNLSSQPTAFPNEHDHAVAFEKTNRFPVSDTGSVETSTDSSIRLVNTTSSEAFMSEPKVRMNSKATTFVANYLKTNNEALVKIKKRSAPYFKIIESVLTKYNLPLELKYLAVVESELKAKAVSRVGAVGPWQLMPQTARWLGLKVTSSYDERTHYYKSTVAAAKYLKCLYAEFGDWLLVIAAYNGGAGTVNKAIKKAGSKNFWFLQYHLPAETRGHVKRFIGAHYYFEEEGSETTLTKTELAAHQKLVMEYQRNQAEAFREVKIDLPVIDDSFTGEMK